MANFLNQWSTKSGSFVIYYSVQAFNMGLKWKFSVNEWPIKNFHSIVTITQGFPFSRYTCPGYVCFKNAQAWIWPGNWSFSWKCLQIASHLIILKISMFDHSIIQTKHCAHLLDTYTIVIYVTMYQSMGHLTQHLNWCSFSLVYWESLDQLLTLGRTPVLNLVLCHFYVLRSSHQYYITLLYRCIWFSFVIAYNRAYT